MFSRGTVALLFYKCLQLCRYLCPGHKLDPVSGVSYIWWPSWGHEVSGRWGISFRPNRKVQRNWWVVALGKADHHSHLNCLSCWWQFRGLLRLRRVCEKWGQHIIAYNPAMYSVQEQSCELSECLGNTVQAVGKCLKGKWQQSWVLCGGTCRPWKGWGFQWWDQVGNYVFW